MAIDEFDFDFPDAEDYFDALEKKTARNTAPAVTILDDEEEEAFDGSAADRCLALPEILERIFLYVPPLELFPVQRVNTLFRDLLVRSISLRRHMFLLPDKYFVRRELNRLLAPNSNSRLRAATMPFHLELFACRTGSGIDIKIHRQWTQRRKEKNFDDIKIDLPNNEEASWRQMLVTTSNAPLQIKLSLPFRQCDYVSELSGDVTLGAVVDEAKRLTFQGWRTQVKYFDNLDYEVCPDEFCFMSWGPGS